MLQSWANDSALLWPPTERKQQVGECWVCVILFPRLLTHEGVIGGAISPLYIVSGTTGGHMGGGIAPGFSFLDIIFGGQTHPWFYAWVYTWFWGTMVFGPWYFVDSMKGTTVMF